MMGYSISFSRTTRVEQETFEQLDDAIKHALENLSSDDFCCIIFDDATGDVACLVFQGRVWK